MNTIKSLFAVAISLATASACYATTYDNTVGGTNGLPDAYGEKVYCISQTLDLSTYASSIVSNDLVKMINIPSETVLLGVTYQISTATTNDVHFSIGDADADLIAADIDGTNATYATETLYATPKLETSATHIGLTVTTNDFGHTGVIKVKALLLDVE